MKHFFTLAALFLMAIPIKAQENITYQKPPKEILDLVDAPSAPTVRIDDKGDYAVLLYRENFKSIEELSEKELRIAGIRVNPVINSVTGQTYFTEVQIKKVNDNQSIKVTNLPDNAKMTGFNWSPDQTTMAFTNTTSTGVELWVVDIKTASAKQLTKAILNNNLGRSFTWFKDSKSLLVTLVPENRKPILDPEKEIPTGPTVSANFGSKAQNRTYQDLLKNKIDETNFELLATSELYVVGVDGTSKLWKNAAMYRGIDFSPNGQYVLISEMKRPFSYIVPLSRFPYEVNLYDVSGNFVKKIQEVPLIEVLPKGFMAVQKGMRQLNWRNDQGATLVWTEALDGGDPAVNVDYRDEVFQLTTPFDGKPQSILKVKNRFSRIYWGDPTTAIAVDNWRDDRNTKTYVFNPSDNQVKPAVISDRNYQDTYSDPGNFITKRNEFGEDVLELDKGNVYLIGDGFSEKGKFPFVDQLNLKTLKTNRLYQSKLTDKLENIITSFNIKKGEILVRIESKNEYPNYYIRNFKKNSSKAVTKFENPYKSLQSVHSEVLTYKREDGLDLSAKLYLPVGYEKGKKYPMVMWAYPREFKDKSSAGQVTANPNEFIYPSYGSPIYWVTRGYVVLDDAAFPIVGEGTEEPNDTFVKQLVGNAKAAIDAVDQLDYIDRTKVAVGGHSYGAFMTANLLSHSDLFAAGIARSGAYNRTLTPFGFQGEERNYWEAPETYNVMSPFMNAHKMKYPLLLVHGEIDDNSGTFPVQSERYFNALKGLGATVRYVVLPNEKHGYRAKESVMHLLWEQDQWLETYVKNKK
ncbi:MAG: prolyl oligopeptidase family serine peptidase [Flavobacteriaceae bacterium]|nr:prolyl oligopeptidase family serine peptidase [Flavobacteriaceae bacterium]